MAGQEDGAFKLPDNVSLTIGEKTFQGECPERLISSEHKLRKTVETKKPSPGNKPSSKAD